MTALSNLDLVLIQQDSYSFVPKGEIIDAAEDRATIVRYPDLIVITIRGTANRTGWWSDFQIAPKVAKVHPQLGVCEAGFLAGAESLWPLIKARIETTPQVPIIVQGHSRGAAIVPLPKLIVELAPVVEEMTVKAPETLSHVTTGCTIVILSLPRFCVSVVM